MARYHRLPEGSSANLTVAQKIEVTAELGAKNRIRVQLGIPSSGLRTGRNLKSPDFKILVGNQYIQAAFFDAQSNLITSANDSSADTAYRLLPFRFLLLSGSDELLVNEVANS